MDSTPPLYESNQDLSALERRLLEAARSDRAPHALSAKMAAGLGLHAGGAALSGGAAATKLGAPLFAKAGLWGVLSLGLIAGTVTWQATRPVPPAPTAAAAPTENAPPAVAPAPAPASGQLGSTSEAPAPSPDGPGVPAAREAVRGGEDALRAEVALLARTREALQRGASARALGLLDQHRRRFARGTLAPEAAALGIEALVQQGAYAQARSKTRQFVASYPAHPLRAHVAQLVAAHVDSARAR